MRFQELCTEFALAYIFMYLDKESDLPTRAMCQNRTSPYKVYLQCTLKINVLCSDNIVDKSATEFGGYWNCRYSHDLLYTSSKGAKLSSLNRRVV